MSEKINVFAAAQTNRENAQAQLEKACGLSPPTRSHGRKNKVRIDLTISEEAKDRLFQYAESKGLSASVIIQMLIIKNCK